MHDFVVLYDDLTGLKKRKMTRGRTIDSDYRSTGYVSNRKLLKRIVTQAKLHGNTNLNNKTADHKFKSQVIDYLNDGVGDIKDRKEKLKEKFYQIIDNVDEEELKIVYIEESVNLSITKNEMNLNANDEDIALEMVNISAKKSKSGQNGDTLDNNEGELILEDDQIEMSVSHRL